MSDVALPLPATDPHTREPAVQSSAQVAPTSPAPSSSPSTASSPATRLQGNVLEAFPALCQSKRYELQAHLRGSLYGCVKIAIDTLHQRLVCIKISAIKLYKERRSLLTGTCVNEDVRREAKVQQYLTQVILPRLQNHGLPLFFARFIEYLQDDEFIYVITEYVDGGDLFDLLDRRNRENLAKAMHPGAVYSPPERALLCESNGRLSEEECRPYMRSLVQAIHTLHACSFVHADLSLENVCIDKQEQAVRLIDWGVARRVDHRGHMCTPRPRPASDSSPCSETNTSHTPPAILGKPSYMSPEMFHRHPCSLFANDVYALGVIMYMLLVGRPPYQVPTTSDSWFNIIISGGWRTDAVRAQRATGIYKHLSADAIDLLDHILKYEKQRYTLADIRQHRWLCTQKITVTTN